MGKVHRMELGDVVIVPAYNEQLALMCACKCEHVTQHDIGGISMCRFMMIVLSFLYSMLNCV